MRSILLALAAVSLAVFGVGKALEGWPSLLSAAVQLQAQPPAPAHRPSAQTWLPSVHIVRVDPALFRAVQQRQAAELGDVVLDLERLESLEAARDVAAIWSQARPAGAPLVCWLAAQADSEAAAAADVLARAGCTELRVLD
jgi:hypothetical protein